MNYIIDDLQQLSVMFI